MESLHDELREIRTDLRLAMNGVISSSMRDKGVVYKLNFGVAYPEIKQIAAKHTASSELAAALWKEDIREFKILASFLQPVDELPVEEAKRWIKEIPYQEIAEHCSRNLFSCLSYREELVSDLLSNGEEMAFARIVAFLMLADISKRGEELSDATIELFVGQAMLSLGVGAHKASMQERFAALQSLKFYGRQTKERAAYVLSAVKEAMSSSDASSELEEIYNELKFEFDYYL